MADTRLVQSGSWAHTAVKHFMSIGTGGFNTAAVGTEPRTKVIQRTAGTYNNLQVNCTARTGSTVISMTKSTVYATAGVTQTLSVTIAGTGITEDTTHTFATIAADMLETTFSALATTLSLIAYTFSATTNTASRFITYASGTGGSGGSYTTSTTSFYNVISGQQPNTAGADNTVEANAQTRIRQAGTLTNLFVNILTNNGTAGFTLSSRVAAGAGALTTGTIATATTGFVEDTTHTDNRVAGDDVDTLLLTGASPNIGTCVLGVDFTSTTSNSGIITGTAVASVTAAAATTAFMGLGGGLTTTATETDVQTTVRDTFTTSNLSSNSTANTVSATSTITVSKNASLTGMNETISWASNTPGLQQDTTHTDVFVATDLVTYKLVTGGTGTSLTLSFVEIWTGFGGAVAAIVYPQFFTTTTSLAKFANAPPMFAT